MLQTVCFIYWAVAYVIVWVVLSADTLYPYYNNCRKVTKTYLIIRIDTYNISVINEIFFKLLIKNFFRVNIFVNTVFIVCN